MQLLIYLAVAVATVFGVLLEINVLVEPARHLEYATFSPGASTQAAPPPAPKTEPPPAQETPAPVAAVPQPSPAEPPAAPALMPAAEGAASAEPAPACDVQACAEAYRSFSAADCTYQPLEGPRRLCGKGTPPKSSAEATPANDAHAEAADGAHCNVSACSEAYTSFSSADCTYQPLEGSRRLCRK